MNNPMKKVVAALALAVGLVFATSGSQRYGYAFNGNLDAESGVQATLSLQGSHVYTDGVSTRALQFTDGQNYGTGFNFGGGDFTIFAIIKAPTTENACIFGFGGQKGTTGMLGMCRTTGNNIKLFTASGAELMTVEVPNATTTYHAYAIRYNSATKKLALSVDGGEFGTEVSFTANANNAQFQFGGVHGGCPSGISNAASGAIDEFRLYTEQLTVAQVNELAAPFQPNRWIGGNGDRWFVPGNWSWGEVPSNGSAVEFVLDESDETDYLVDLGDAANISLSSITVTGTAKSFGFRDIGVVAANSFSTDFNLTIPDTSVTLQLKANGISLASGKKISGAGRLVLVGEGVSGTALSLIKAKLPGLDEADWTGTVELRDWNGETDGNNAKFSYAANPNSTLCFNGYRGYALTGNENVAKEFVIGENGLTLIGKFSSNDVILKGKLTGGGAITVAMDSSSTTQFVKFIGDTTAFTGSVNFGTTKFKAAFVNDASTALDGSLPAGTMVIGTGVTAGVWTVNAPCNVMAGAHFTTIAPTINGEITFGDSVEVTIANYGDTIIHRTGYAAGTVIATTVTGTVGGEPIEAGCQLVTSAEGVRVGNLKNITWKGGSGTITADNWQGGTYGEVAATGVVRFPANVASETITVPDDTTGPLVLDLNGAYILKGEGNGYVWEVSSLTASDDAEITLDGLTMRVISTTIPAQRIKLVNGARLISPSATLTLAAGETLTMQAGTCYTLGRVPSFDATSTIKIANAATMADGNYKLIEWALWPNCDLLKYGKPVLDITGYPGVVSRVRLVPQVYDLTLQVMSEAQANRKPLVIVPVGDSITEGLNNAGGSGKNYRIPLFNKLSLAGYNVRSVGYWKQTATGGGALQGSYDPSGTLITDPNWAYHCGRGSMRAGAMGSGNASVHDQFANDIDLGGNPDVVLLHIGINDMLNNGSYNDSNGTKTYQYLTNMIVRAVNGYPKTTFLISSPMCCEYGHSQQTRATASSTSGNDCNKNFCQPLHTMMLDFFTKARSGEIAGLTAKAAEKIYFADLYENVMPRWYGDEPDTFINDSSDKCHPNWLGHELMAETWFTQITNAFPNAADTSNYNYQENPPEVTTLGAAANVPLEYRQGFVKARVWQPNATDRRNQKAMTASDYTWARTAIPDNAEIEKVAYFFEYVRPTPTGNLHRYVWADMDPFAAGCTLADVGIPTAKKTQQVVSNLHVYGNHPAVWNVPADESGVEGFIEFSPWGTGPNASGVTGAPANWYNFDWNDTLNTSGNYGCMQLHRKLATLDLNRPAQVVFAYNGFTTTDTAQYPGFEFGIGNFAQSFNGSSGMDWTDLRKSETMGSTNLSLRSIEIWVKVKGWKAPSLFLLH